MPVLTLVIILLLLAAPPAQAQNQGTRLTPCSRPTR